jgi:hypothetical protein
MRRGDHFVAPNPLHLDHIAVGRRRQTADASALVVVDINKLILDHQLKPGWPS